MADKRIAGDASLPCKAPCSTETTMKLSKLSQIIFVGVCAGSFGSFIYGDAILCPPSTDFNHNGKPDYVLYNGGTPRTGVWYMNNNVFLGGAFGPILPAGWRLAGVADFNADGRADYLLFNPGTRQSVIWYLAGVTFVGGAVGPTIASGYELKGTADFNGNGKPDYLLYNPITRRTAIWYLNNNTFIGSAFGPTLTAGWSLVAP